MSVVARRINWRGAETNLLAPQMKAETGHVTAARETPGQQGRATLLLCERRRGERV